MCFVWHCIDIKWKQKLLSKKDIWEVFYSVASDHWDNFDDVTVLVIEHWSLMVFVING